MFEAAATKLPHYTLPLYPALALISARAVLAGSRALPQIRNTGARLGFGVWFLLGCGIALLPSLLLGMAWNVGPLDDPPAGSPRMSGVGPLELTIIAIGTVIGLVLLTIALRRALQGRLLDAQLFSIPAGAISLAMVFGLALPAAWPIWITPRIVHHLQAGDALVETVPVAAIGFQEDSLVHATNGRLEPIDEGRFAAWCDAHPGGWVVLPEGMLPAGYEDTIRGRVSGFNYSNGNWFDLAVIRVTSEAR